MLSLIRQSILILVEIVQLAILVRVLLSFFPNLRYNKYADIVYQITDPIIRPCQMILERLGLGNTMFDFSPILAYFILRIIVMMVYRIF